MPVHTQLALCLVLTLLGCSADSITSGHDLGPPDGGPDPDAVVIERAHQARVFRINPLATPTPELVRLDAEDTLTSPADKAGLRRLVVYSCVDQGETMNVPMMGQQKVCTLKQLASSKSHGSFDYPDWDGAVNGTLDVSDVHAEVELYYHASRIYDFVVSTGLFDHLPGRHDVNGALEPITLVANYQLPASPTATTLTPARVALYIPREMGQMGMWSAQGLAGIKGDALVFGQGQTADFAYDGETVYHEFGHLIAAAMAGWSYNVYLDSYGLNRVSNAINEGVADTFAFLVSGRSTLFDYLDQVEIAGFFRNADNKAAFPDDIQGLDPFDGQIVAGANYETVTLLSPKLDRRIFARVLLQVLGKLKALKARVTLEQYADRFLEALGQEGYSASVPAVKQIFTRRGFYHLERAKAITSYDGTDKGQVLFTGGTADMMQLLLLEGQAISPAAIQVYVDLAAGATQLTLAAQQGAMHDTSGTLDYTLLVREGAPVLYAQSAGVLQVTYDTQVDPLVAGQKLTWTLTDLKPLTRYYLHLVNRGTGGGAVGPIAVSMAGR